MGNRGTVPEKYKQAVEKDYELPNSTTVKYKQGWQVITKEPEPHPLYYLYNHRLPVDKEKITCVRIRDGIPAQHITVRSRKVKFDDVLDPVPRYSELHPFLLDYDEGVPNRQDKIRNTVIEKVRLRSRKVKFDDVLDPVPRYSEIHPFLMDYGEGVSGRQNQTRNIVIEKVLLKSRQLKFDDVLDTEPKYSELHPFLLDYGEAVSGRQNKIRNIVIEKVPLKSRQLKFDDVLDIEPKYSELHPFLLDYGEGFPRETVSKNQQWNLLLVSQRFHQTAASISFSPSSAIDISDAIATCEPVLDKMVHFTAFSPLVNHKSSRKKRKNRHKIFKLSEYPIQTHSIIEAERILNQSLVVASHCFWSLKTTFLKPNSDDEQTQISVLEDFAKPRIKEIAPISVAPNREFLSKGCPEFGRLRKIPQIDASVIEQHLGQNMPNLESDGLDHLLEDEEDLEVEDVSEVLVKDDVPKSIVVGIDTHYNLRHGNLSYLKDTLVKKAPSVATCKVQVTLLSKGMMAADIEEYLLTVSGQKMNVFNVKHSERQTLCIIEMRSKSAAGKFKAKMDKIQNQTLCYVNIIEDVIDEAVVKEAFKIRNARMMEKKREVLSSHKQKILEIIETKMKKMKSTKRMPLSQVENALEENEVLRQKKDELENQQREFVEFVEEFNEQFGTIPITQRYEEQGRSFETRFMIETERFERALPMYAKREQIVNMIKENQVSILLGETGSGKSTQVTQYLFEAGLAKQGRIICTQPRKVAATSLAKRVAVETHCQLGDLVGFKVGMQKKLTQATRILYVTDHILLRECLEDPLLSAYSCIIIDEAHERSLNTDLLLGMIKRALPKRPELRIIVTSATIDPQIFVKFFDGCPVLKVSGRVFPVQIEYSDEPLDLDSNFEQRAAEKAVQIARSDESGDILVFLTTPQETERVCEKVGKMWPSGQGKLMCLALHGKTQGNDQQKVFDPTPQGKRKIVFATNSAETSVTIPGIKFVVDTGLAKEKLYDPAKNMSTLKVNKISKSSADQRKGRAGRTESGKCFRLYSKEDYETMETSAKPEILRVHLGMALLTLMSFKISDPLSFDFVEMPPKIALVKALDVLIYLGAVKDGELTHLGKKLSCISLEPRLGKLVLDGVTAGIGFESVFAASFSAMGGSMFYRGGSDNDKKQADKLKVRFCNMHGDIHTMLEVYKEWHNIPEKEKNKWCIKNSINAKSMRMARETVKEILDTLSHDLNLRVPQKFAPNIANMEDTLEELILGSFAMNLCVFTGCEKLGFFSVMDPDNIFHVHPSSALKPLAKMPRFLVFENTLTTSRDFIINVTCISDEKFAQHCQNHPEEIDIMAIERRTVYPCKLSNIGNGITKKMIGPRHSTRISLEKDLQMHLRTEMVSLEVNVDLGVAEIYSPKSLHEVSLLLVEDVIVREQACLFQEEIERPLVEGTSTRAVLGHGGNIKHLLFSDEFRAIRIPSVPADISVHELVGLFREIGVVTDYESGENKSKITWMKVVFEHPDVAEEVLQLVDYGHFGNIKAKPDLTGAKGIAPPATRDISLKATWCRRPNKGIAFVKFQPCHSHVVASIASSLDHVFIGDSMRPSSITLSKKNQDELFVRNLPRNLPNDEISRAIKDHINTHTSCTPKDVVIPNEFVEETCKSDCNQYKAMIESKIGMIYPQVANVTITVRQPTPKAIQNVAFINVKDALDAENIRQAIEDMSIMGQEVRVTLNLKSSVTVRKEIYWYVQDLIQEQIESLEMEGGINIRGKVYDSGDYRIDISASSSQGLTKARGTLTKCLEGKRVEVVRTHHLAYFKTFKGKQFLQKVQHDCSVHIMLDTYESTLFFHGTRTKTEKGINRIMKKISALEHSPFKSYDLKAKFPPGMTKLLMTKYGLDLERMLAVTFADVIELHLRDHILTAQGSIESIENTDKILEAESTILGKRVKITAELDDVELECPVCLCEPESKEVYRLEYCGHAYCRDCVNNLFDQAIQGKSFPITCAAEGCSKDIVVQDIFAVVGKSMGKLEKFIQSSIDSYMAMNGDSFSYCITPNCGMVYRRYNERGVETCGLCGVQICIQCEAEYHEGISCELNTEIKDKLNGRSFDEYSRETWLKEDPRNRALCPKCSSGIEKNGGCLHVTCIKCKAHICWKCKKMFPSGGETYTHLGSCYGDIYDPDE